MHSDGSLRPIDAETTDEGPSAPTTKSACEIPDAASMLTSSETRMERTLSFMRYSAPHEMARSAMRESNSVRSTVRALGFFERTSTTLPSGNTASAPNMVDRIEGDIPERHIAASETSPAH